LETVIHAHSAERPKEVAWKNETTKGNIWTIIAVLLSAASMLVATTLAYGKLSARQDVQDMRLTIDEANIIVRTNAQQLSETKINDIQRDVGIMKVILCGIQADKSGSHQGCVP
jgi:hypothetical protein